MPSFTRYAIRLPSGDQAMSKYPRKWPKVVGTPSATLAMPNEVFVTAGSHLGSKLPEGQIDVPVASVVPSGDHVGATSPLLMSRSSRQGEPSTGIMYRRLWCAV